ncbi:FadR/GntR family transcriptional regulator [Dubosiella muris]|uniref:FadR family transcriptional regulator n=2 Tax=Dubosiella TaxID=1937008 RepID=A0AC61R8U6_9FIRM|nr:GntR family transcriptional regulator [Dubosiella muris]TGY66644.1 FadR family transcriptional regulator [Dubosiella muris]
MAEMEKTYEKVVESIKNQVMDGTLVPGSKLPTERTLAKELDVSRNSVREGLRVLQNIGIISSQQGSGNYISLNFDQKMTEVLSFMYFLKGIDETQVTEFRWIIEEAALRYAVIRATAEEKKGLLESLAGLESATSEAERIQWDQQIHARIVQASHNDFLIANYNAFTSFMDEYIKSMRQRIIRGLESNNMLEVAHHEMVYGILNEDIQLSMHGLRDHFGYIEKYRA